MTKRTTRKTTSKKSLSQKQVGLKHGFRSGLEGENALQLEEAGVEYAYEQFKLRYEKPATYHTYTPDFVLFANGIIVETKGRFVTEDRKKHLLIKAQYPDLDIRFVFSNPNARISKKSKTTYAMWCEKHGFLYSKGEIPQEWIDEPGSPAAIEAAKKFLQSKGT